MGTDSIPENFSDENILFFFFSFFFFLRSPAISLGFTTFG